MDFGEWSGKLITTRATAYLGGHPVSDFNKELLIGAFFAIGPHPPSCSGSGIRNRFIQSFSRISGFTQSCLQASLQATTPLSVWGLLQSYFPVATLK
jgi:hypothetical protein